MAMQVRSAPLPRHRFWLAALLLCASALADPGFPEKLLGVWSTDGSTLQGERLISGQALYLDLDGMGAMLSVNGRRTAKTLLNLTDYSESEHRLEVDLIDGGQVQGHLTLNYDEAQSALVRADDPGSLYHRRKLQMSPDIRQALGLPPTPQSVPHVRLH